MSRSKVRTGMQLGTFAKCKPFNLTRFSTTRIHPFCINAVVKSLTIVLRGFLGVALILKALQPSGMFSVTLIVSSIFKYNNNTLLDLPASLSG